MTEEQLKAWERIARFYIEQHREQTAAAGENEINYPRAVLELIAELRSETAWANDYQKQAANLILKVDALTAERDALAAEVARLRENINKVEQNYDTLLDAAETLRYACANLANYRISAGALGFQLEKFDDYLREIVARVVEIVELYPEPPDGEP